MDPAILSAASALAGSVIGGVSTLAASWLSQRDQMHVQVRVQESVKREALYAEFIVEASNRFTEAYADPPRSYDEARERVRHGDEDDPLREFAEACREELRNLRG